VEPRTVDPPFTVVPSWSLWRELKRTLGLGTDEWWSVATVKTTLASPRSDPYVLALAVLFAFEWVGLAISPRYRQDWALENALTITCVIALALFRNRLPLSRISYTALFVFLSLHSIGAHYTYSEVPYDAWIRTLTGRSISDVFGVQRNYYDRFVHFSYGFLFVYPIRDILVRIAGVRGIWSYYLPIAIASSTSLDYEVIEWGAASAFGGDLGVAYLGTQGDVWDAQKDMALAVLGAILSMSLLAIGNVLRRDA
jgi:putative membrane protein